MWFGESLVGYKTHLNVQNKILYVCMILTLLYVHALT